MFEIERLGVSADDAAKVVRGVAEGKYSLLTGAGFSLGAKCNYPGMPEAPTSLELACMLAKKFGITLIPEGASDLPLAYEDSIRKCKDKARVFEYLRSILTGLVPTWHSVLNDFSWRRVWTFNIDDLPSSIWGAGGRRINSIHFKDAYEPVSHLDQALQVIYLHGRLESGRSVAASDEVIFSLLEYVAATRDPGAWHEAFFSEFSDQPMIICGASATGEIDLARTFRSGNQSRKARDMPSLAVVCGARPEALERFQDPLGLIALNCGGDVFFQALSADVTSYKSATPQMVVAGASSIDAMILGSQFLHLTEQKSVRTSRASKHDFYSGDEPLWDDILNELDANTRVGMDAVGYIDDCWRRGETPVVIASGDAGCGKSTGLLRILRECLRVADHCFLFRNEDGFSVDAVVRCMPIKSKVVFGFDMAADYSLEIADLAAALVKRDMQFAIVAADRTKRRQAMRNDLQLTTPRLLDFSVFCAADAGRLYHKRKRNHRLGSLTNATETEFRRFLSREHDGNVFSAMAALEGGGGQGFAYRLDVFVKDSVKGDGIVNLAHAVSLTHRWGYPLPLRSASLVSGIDTSDLAAMCMDDGSLADVFTLNPKGVAFRHRVLATRFFDSRKDYEVRQRVLVRLISSLAPLVTPAAVTAKTHAHLVCRAITGRNAVLDAVNNIDAARRVYEDVEPAMGHNSRFWEQRALLESSSGQHPRAYSYAREAVARESHAFPYTTLGGVCMAQALSLAENQPRVALERFKEGNAALLNAMALARRNELIGKPIRTFLNFAIKFYPYAETVPGGGSYLVDEWGQWMSKVKRSKVIDDLEIQRYEADWLKVCIAGA